MARNRKNIDRIYTKTIDMLDAMIELRLKKGYTYSSLKKMLSEPPYSYSKVTIDDNMFKFKLYYK